MNPIPRAYSLLRTTNVPMLRAVFRTTIQSPSLRFYGQSAYGGYEKSPAKSDISRAKEHPGPPPPDTKSSSTSSQESTGGSSPTSPSSPSRSDPQAEAESQQPYSSTAPGAPKDPEKSEAHQIQREPSNKAHPTITTGKQSPNVDDEGHRRKDIPEDVKEHNRGVEQRHDRSYNQITDEGKVQKGF
ncbi:uncharacterized protein EURHEDRAFT_386776 [Aspergillus ruber CBS 135680]|uniref:Uncharacterized protein n=1 Tax=Aspergillus ruber (strain CBS 135680) TaxID=1388766 RepID=A0A017SCC9_ASPRC|nr:uncharacterized protein EURHEDRAFT_386776 [Aspergillus ruber CBS 135680]EYE94557.1 hypothetical protein EURHEDRAFT_386776 [Aspergillus ruber CBS 135680]